MDRDVRGQIGRDVQQAAGGIAQVAEVQRAFLRPGDAFGNRGRAWACR